MPHLISALFYLQFTSFRNRFVRRVQRLKQPKYLLGAIAGGLYFYFYFFRYVFGIGTSRHPLPASMAPDTLVLLEGAGALMLLIFAVLAWVIPRERAALAFTEAEVAFLFAAPVSRRGLIHYKLLRSQSAILFTSLIMCLLSNRMAGKVWVHAAGWWLIFSMLNLHNLGASFARTMLLDRGITNALRRAVVFSLVLVFGLALLAWARRALPAIQFSQLQGPEDLKDWFQQALTSGPLPWLLYPFRVVVRPYLAQSSVAFLTALLPALALLALHYLWVIRANVAFEEASVEASRKLAETIAAMRGGKWHGSPRSARPGRAPFKLNPLGPAPVALLWKNLISAGQTFTWRVWLALLIGGGSFAIVLGHSTSGSSIAVPIGMIMAFFAVWLLLLGPQFFKQDFRQDLFMADLLKMYPLRGWQISLGEVLGPATILTALQWLLLLFASVLLLGSGLGGAPGAGGPDFLGGETVGLAVKAATTLALAMLFPVLNLLLLILPNAAALLLPQWFLASREGAHGIEATGQRLIFMFGQLLAFALALVPPVGAAAICFFGFRMVLALPATILLSSAAATLLLAAEAAAGIILLGKLFERFDLTSDQAPGG